MMWRATGTGTTEQTVTSTFTLTAAAGYAEPLSVRATSRKRESGFRCSREASLASPAVGQATQLLEQRLHVGCKGSCGICRRYPANQFRRGRSDTRGSERCEV
jgi:hypothetical protein